MYYTNIVNQLTLLIIVCFSFYIYVFTLSMNKNKSLLKVLGLAFFIPLFLSVGSLFPTKEIISKSLITLSELSLVTVLFLILIINPKKKFYNILIIGFYIFPALLYALVTYVNVLPKYIVMQGITIPLFTAITVFSMYILRKEKGTKSLIFWAMLFILFSTIIKIIGNYTAVDYFNIIFKLGSYIIFVFYFYKETTDKLLVKVLEADKKLTAVNKSLDLEVKKRILEIERSNEKLVNISKTDSLTKALNKTAIFANIDNLLVSKANNEFCILMFDIDSFKTINDTLGHVIGDKCLKKLSIIANSCIRDVDRLGRFGGDEFVIVLPDASISHARLIAERFRKKVDETDAPHFTISMGIASYPNDGISLKDLINAADDGLYQSKRKGKNTVSHRNLF